MSEREIRTMIEKIRADLNRGVRKVVVPAAVGASLALAGCDSTTTTTPDTGGPDAAVMDTISADQKATDQKTADQKVADQKAADQKAADQKAPDTIKKLDWMPPPPYMAPDAAPLYKALG